MPDSSLPFLAFNPRTCLISRLLCARWMRMFVLLLVLGFWKVQAEYDEDDPQKAFPVAFRDYV